jgi:hypothetical protein
LGGARDIVMVSPGGGGSSAVGSPLEDGKGIVVGRLCELSKEIDEC